MLRPNAGGLFRFTAFHGLTSRKQNFFPHSGLSAELPVTITMPPTKPKKYDTFEPQFINVTNSIFLDSKARTSVRSQVMREYHRRRTQKIHNPVVESQQLARQQVPLTAKEQSQKFRLSGKKTFQAWVTETPDALALSKTTNFRHCDASVNGRKKMQKPSRRAKSIPEAFPLGSSNLGKIILEAPYEEDLQQQIEILQELLGNLNLTVSIPINNQPAASLMDPFDSMSLLLDVRTQTLLHHYCKSNFSLYTT